MAVTQSPRLNLTEWSAPGDPFTRAQLEHDHEQLEALVAIDVQDLLANRAAPGVRGRYFAESAASAGLPGAVWRDDGASWRTVGSRIVPNASGDIGQIVRGAVGQTADLAQWQDSAGTQLSTIDKSGVYNVTGVAYVGANADPTTLLRARSATQRAVLVQGAASQSADLQQWQTSAGAVLARVRADGLIGDDGGGNYLNGPSGITTSIIPRSTSSVGLRLRGIASSTVDLAEWQDSAGALQGGITNQGFLFAGNGFPGGMIGIKLSTPTSRGMVVQGAPSQSADLQQWTDSASATLARVDKGGFLYSQGVSVTNAPSTGASIFGQVPTGQGAGVAFLLLRDTAAQDIFRVMPTGQVVNVLNSAGTAGSVTKGAASQTANLAEWQNSAGSVLAKVTASGQMSPAGIDSFGTVIARTNGTGNLGVAVQAASGQTADLQQWQTSAGAAVAKVKPSGDFVANGYGAFGFNADPGFLASLNVQALNATTPTVRLARLSGQSVDMLSVRTEGNADIAHITSTGNVAGTGAYTTLSDVSVKRNVQGLRLDPTEVIRKLRPVHFDYIGGDRDQVGFIAQEVEAVLPFAVTPFDQLPGGIPDVDGRLGLRDGVILAYLVAAVQRLIARNN